VAKWVRQVIAFVEEGSEADDLARSRVRDQAD